MKRMLCGVLAALLLSAPAPARATPAAEGEVTAVSVMAASGRAELVVTVRGTAQVRDFVLREPTRLVVDLVGAKLTGQAAKVYDGQNRAGILNVRTNQFKPDVVRIVIDLDAVKDYRIERVGETVRVSFGTDETFLAWSTTAPDAQADALPNLARVAPRRAPEVAVAPAETPDPVRRPRLVPGENDRITVVWENASIADVVTGFAAFSGRTIILGKGISGNVTAEIKDTPWQEAFQAILSSQGLMAQELPGGIIRVDAPSVLASNDSLEPLETQVVRLNYHHASELSKSLEGMMTKNRGKLVADTALNALMITDTRSRIQQISDFARGMDVRTPQISIQSKIIFVDRTDLQQLGFKYDLGSQTQFFNRLIQRPNPLQNGQPFPATTNIVDLGGNSISAIANADQNIVGSALDLVYSMTIGRFTLTSFLQALERLDLSDVQAEPVISTLDNRVADILVGEETPVRVIDASATTVGNSAPRATVQFKNTGIRLTVTPHVTNNRKILMNLRTERSAIQPLAGTDLGYIFPTQVATAQLLVSDGETAVIGGLTITEVTKSRSGIPLLSGLPIVGGLFSYTSNQERRRDLIILVTPKIIDEVETQ